MSCNVACNMPTSSKLMQQTEHYFSCNECKCPNRKKKSKRIKKLNCKKKCETKLDCNKDFTPSGMKPETTAGPLSGHLSCCTRYAPFGCWESCKNPHSGNDESCERKQVKAPFGPYGPWSSIGPSQFKVVRSRFMNVIYPKSRKIIKRDGLARKTDEPMGKMRPWPMSGSCRFAGRPYGPCRPCGAFKSRGPFGVWAMTGHVTDYIGRPETPAQPCWKPAKPGYRPCTPCQRPLFRPCRGKCMTKAVCSYVKVENDECE